MPFLKQTVSRRDFLKGVLAGGLLCVGPAILPAKANQQDSNNPGETTLEGKAGKHVFRVSLAKRPFVKAKHQVKITDKGTMVDGKYAHGTDASIPNEELSRFEVIVDGRKWTIPGKFWRDCYNPNLKSARATSSDADSVDVQAWLSQDGKRLTVKMLGSDGAGSYRVIWFLQSNGKHRREFESLD